MITKTQYHYTCLTKQGFTKSFILLSTNNGIILYDQNLGRAVKNIEEAETYLCTEFTDVLLVSKTEITTVKIEKPIYFQTSIIGDTEKWCKCSGTYSNSEDIICPKCNNPIP